MFQFFQYIWVKYKAIFPLSYASQDIPFPLFCPSSGSISRYSFSNFFHMIYFNSKDNGRSKIHSNLTHLQLQLRNFSSTMHHHLHLSLCTEWTPLSVIFPTHGQFWSAFATVGNRNVIILETVTPLHALFCRFRKHSCCCVRATKASFVDWFATFVVTDCTNSKKN